MLYFCRGHFDSVKKIIYIDSLMVILAIYHSKGRKQELN